MLTISDLFTPQPSGVTPNANLAPVSGSWLDFLITACQQVGLPTTAWQPGGPERTILSVYAEALAQEDNLISIMAQGGFLDFAASGTITVQNFNGTSTTVPVTPDPSIPSQNPTGAPGWLDALGTSFFNEPRLQATYASGELSVVNTTVGTLTYVAGSYHIANTLTGYTYANTLDISVPPSLLPAGAGIITAVVVSPSTTTITTQTAHGLSPNQVVYVNGASGVTGVNQTFSTVSSVPSSTTFIIPTPSAGTWTSGGSVYLCTIITIQADIIGLVANASPGAITTTVTQATGVYVSNVGALSATNYESNTAYAARCRLKLASISPNGPAQAYNYIALTAQSILADQTPPITLTNGAIIKAITYANPQTEIVSCVISSASPASVLLGGQVTPGCAQLAVSNATNATPIVITTVSEHGLSTGFTATISGALGNTAANQTAAITYISTTTFSLDDSVGNGTYTGGGLVEGGDLGQVDNLLQATTVPDNAIAQAESSLAFPVTVIATVVVPQAYLATYQVAAPIALQNLLATYPIGGNILPGETTGIIPYDAIDGALFSAGVLTVGSPSYVRDVQSLTVNGVTIDVPYPGANYDAQLVTPVITVRGV